LVDYFDYLFNSSSILPSDDKQFYLGSSSLEWKDIYAQNVYVSGVISGSISGSSSNAISASYALSASHALESDTSISASHADNSDQSISASHALTSDTSISASHALNADSSLTAVSASHVLVADTSLFASSAGTASILSNPYTIRGFKSVDINTASYSTVLSVNLSITRSAYIKLNLCGGMWPTVGPIGYLAEYFIQKGDGSTQYSQPGVIIQELNHNSNGGKVKSKIVDSGLTVSASTFDIQFLSNKSNITNAVLVYDVMGAFNSIS